MDIRLCVTCICAGLAAFAQTNENPSPLRKTFDKPHQLRDFAIELQLAGWPVSFEEGPVVSAEELVQKTSPTGIPVVVKRVVPLTVSLSGSELAATDNQARKTIIERVFSSYAALGNRDRYSVRSEGRYLDIVPLQIQSADGVPQRFEPVLDTKIAFPEQRFQNLYALVDAVLEQVAQKRGVSVVLGNVPSNIFRHYSVVETATDEPARDVLERAFAEINGPRLAGGLNAIALPWTLTYDPTNSQYWFAVNAAEMRLSGAPSHKAWMPNDANEMPTGAPHTVRKQ